MWIVTRIKLLRFSQFNYSFSVCKLSPPSPYSIPATPRLVVKDRRQKDARLLQRRRRERIVNLVMRVARRCVRLERNTFARSRAVLDFEIYNGVFSPRVCTHFEASRSERRKIRDGRGSFVYPTFLESFSTKLGRGETTVSRTFRSIASRAACKSHAVCNSREPSFGTAACSETL